MRAKDTEPMSWTPSHLAELIKVNDGLIDPEKYIKLDEDKAAVYSSIDRIKKVHNLTSYIIFVSRIAGNSTNLIENIETFVDYLAAHIAKYDRENDKNTIFILLDVLDRHIRIRLGSHAKRFISEYALQSYTYEIKQYLRRADYGRAGKSILSSIENGLSMNKGDSFLNNSNNSPQYPALVSEIIILIIITASFCSLFLCLVITSVFYCKVDNSQIEDRLNRIAQISKKRQLNTEFIRETCVICLDSLNIKTSYNDTNPSSGSISTRLLDCDHCFHESCITIWKSKESTCPLCRTCIIPDINAKTSDIPFLQDLVRIQEVVVGNMGLYSITYSDHSFSWSRIEFIQPVQFVQNASHDNSDGFINNSRKHSYLPICENFN